MIGKQVKGRSFRGLLNYLHEKEQARLIGGNMAGKTPRALAAEFRVARERNPRLQKAVYHASLALPKGEVLEDDRWCDIADDYIAGMGFEESQYAVYRHSDRDHDHIHIVASRIRILDGTTVTDSWDYPRSEKVIRELEKQYQLTPTPSSRERDRRAPTTGEMRRVWRTGEVGTRELLLTQIEQATADSPTMPEFMNQLQQNGVNVRVGYTRTGKVKGISYALDEVAFSGTKLGRAYTFPGLQKHRDVRYSSDMQAAIEAINQRSPLTAEERWQQQQERTQIVAPILYQIIQSADDMAYQGQTYATHWDGSHLTLTRLSDDQQLMQAAWNVETERWEPTELSQLGEQEVEQLQRGLKRFEQQQQHDRTQTAAAIIAAYLERLGEDSHQGRHYEARWEDECLVFVRRQDHAQLMTARWDETTGIWEQVEPSQLQAKDIESLNQVYQRLQAYEQEQREQRQRQRSQLKL